MNKKIFFLVVVFLLTGQLLSAQKLNYLITRTADGAKASYALADVRKIVLENNTMTVNMKAGAGDNATGIIYASFSAIFIPKEAIPEAGIDYLEEKLTDLENSTTYLINGAIFTSGSDGKITIDPTWFGNSLSIVKKGNEVTTFNSDPQTLPVPARPEAPSVDVVKGSEIGVIHGTDETMEHRFASGSSSAPALKSTTAEEWVTCTSHTTTVSAAGDYHVRLKAVEGTDFAGEIIVVNVSGVIITSLPALNLSGEKVIATEYYNLQGVKIAQPAQGNIYLLKKIFESGKTQVEKIIQ